MILVLFVLSSCDREDDLPFELTAEGLVGTWEQYQYRGSTGIEKFETEYESTGKTITFFSDGEWESVDFFECDEGEYSVTDQILTMIFQCDDPVKTQLFRLKREKDQLIISPSCFEGCFYVFEKI
ncbi:MAG: hypothetical protein ACJLTB_21170 [Algoriphagus aquaeductus]|jgi:hypothetical protein|uniref:hypothetical protein n=1 Tax=Algoriphagus aquaeductus TaxID=475299 RepID=UPI0038792D30